MPVLSSDIYCYGSLQMPETDEILAVGSGIDTSTKISFEDLSASGINGGIGVVANAATTANVTVYGRNSAGELISETKALNGTAVQYMTSNTAWNRLLKATRGTSQQLDVAVVSSGTFLTGTLAAGGTTSVTLPAGASASDNAYQFKILRMTGGAAAGSLAQIISYNGTSKVAELFPTLSGTASTDTFVIHDGMLLDSHPTIIMTCRRPFYNSSADVSTGVARSYYDKVFLKNNHATLALTNAVISEFSDPTGNVTFALTSGLNDTGTNGSNNRQVAPTANINGSFDSANKNVANSQNHTAGAAQAVWLKLTLAAGASATNSYYILRETGQSI